MAGYKDQKPSAPEKPPLTHFLCLPLVTPQSKPQLEKSLQQFRDAATSTASVMPGIHAKAIRPVGALHCTLGVMSLDQEQLHKATQFLANLDIQRLIRDEQTPQQRVQPFEIDLKGLVSMHAPRNTSILYCAPTDSDGSEKLYPFCLAVRKAFSEQRLLVEDDRKLKLHATIMNTIYAKGRKKRSAKPRKTAALDLNTPDPQNPPNADQEINQAPRNDEPRSAGHGPHASAPLKIDATALLEQYKDVVWAQNVALDRIAICEMGAKKILNEQGEVVAEEYKEVASLKLPT
ncbi:hypothetical protein EJ03DRAFT_278850 [Teratosphaeria nubilosa]|uniref:A-kinase anchor protein 7-like phosphoesterase domain-containing protein n=1 Tax=Teratosphaeria nubilosa TaxID=161662 RepID=A0A6G1L1D8_9PEZI|nr:hypothetical protein EJ03DRAFT_278850 [Teratosphaeria nubilosa]